MPLDFLSPLHKASRQLGVHLETRLRPLGISAGDAHLLAYLHLYAPAPVGELVRVFGLKQSTLTSILDRLEGAGLLRREVNGSDRRSLLLHVTDEGHELAERLDGMLTAMEDEIRAHLTAEELAGFRAVMRAVEEVTRVRLRDG